MMRLVTVHLPEEFVSGLDELVRMKRYPNRSEAIRLAIRDLLRDELWVSQRTFYEPREAPREVISLR